MTVSLETEIKEISLLDQTSLKWKLKITSQYVPHIIEIVCLNTIN